MASRCVPGVGKWQMFAHPSGKHSYRFETDHGDYSVMPIQSDRERFRGYTVTHVAAHGYTSGTGGLHEWVNPDGSVASFPLTLYRSPQKAAQAANLHCQRMRQKGLRCAGGSCE